MNENVNNTVNNNETTGKFSNAILEAVQNFNEANGSNLNIGDALVALSEATAIVIALAAKKDKFSDCLATYIMHLTDSTIKHRTIMEQMGMK